MRFNILGALTALTLTLAAAHAAQAGLVTERLFGTIITAGENNRFGLEVGDVLGGSATFDSELLTGIGFETLSASDHPALQLELRIGSFSFDEDDHRSFSDGPTFVFHDGTLIGIDFIAEFLLPEFDPPDLITFYNFQLLLNLDFPQFEFSGPGVAAVSGVFAIPEPGALALLGVGLAGIVALRRRRAPSRAA